MSGKGASGPARFVTVAGTPIAVTVREDPFREGVELSCEFHGELVRISDRQLGEGEALRLLQEELERRHSAIVLKEQE